MGPLINNALCPRRNWHRANVLSLANQVGAYRVLLAGLKIFQSESKQFGASQTAANQHSQNRAIALAPQAGSLWFREQRSGRLGRQPDSYPNTQAWRTFNASDSGCHFGTQ